MVRCTVLLLLIIPIAQINSTETLPSYLHVPTLLLLVQILLLLLLRLLLLQWLDGLALKEYHHFFRPYKNSDISPQSSSQMPGLGNRVQYHNIFDSVLYLNIDAATIF